MKYFLFKEAASVSFRKKLYQTLFLGIVFAGLIVTGFSQNMGPEIKAEMIDSANEARLKKYLYRCFPEYAIMIKFEQDSSNLCSADLAFWVANDISEDQMPKLKKLMVDISKHYNNKNEPVLIEYGLVPASIDLMYDHMFKEQSIVIYWPEKIITYSRIEELVAAFNKVTYSYMGNKKNKFTSQVQTVK